MKRPLLCLLACSIPCFASADSDLDAALRLLEKHSADKPRSDDTTILSQESSAPAEPQPASPPQQAAAARGAAAPQNSLFPAPFPSQPAVSPSPQQPRLTVPSPPPAQSAQIPMEPKAQAADDAQTVWALDPRQRISIEDSAREGYEMTSLSVQRVLVAAGYPKDADKNAQPLWAQKIPITIPVLYPSRTLRLDAAQTAKAKDVLRRLEALREKAQEVEKESKALLADWNAIMGAGTPVDALFADSASLPANQGDIPINRDPVPGFAAGQGISFTVGSK